MMKDGDITGRRIYRDTRTGRWTTGASVHTRRCLRHRCRRTFAVDVGREWTFCEECENAKVRRLARTLRDPRLKERVATIVREAV